MSGADNGPPPPGPGRRKDGRPFREGNTREDGSYVVGKNRTPEQTRFRENDGRSRGRRAEGVRNADTEFERELSRRTIVRENGVERKVSKSHSVDLRLIHNAAIKGDNRAIEMVDQRRRRIAADREETARRYHNMSDVRILEQYLRDRADELQIDPGLFGDPEPGPDPETGHG